MVYDTLLEKYLTDPESQAIYFLLGMKKN